MAVKYKTPHEYQDSDIWFKFFTKTELLLLAPALLLDAYLIITKIGKPTSEWIVAAIIIILVSAPAFIFAKMTMPKNMPLLGGGIKIRKVGTRILLYYLFRSGRTIYTRNYEKGWEKEKK